MYLNGQEFLFSCQQTHSTMVEYLGIEGNSLPIVLLTMHTEIQGIIAEQRHDNIQRHVCGSSRNISMFVI